MADQIVDDLRTRILAGSLPDGSRLPSERELAMYYDVSGPTIREAVRVLTAMGLVDARNGSRATVNAQGDTMLAMSIASVVQVENVGAREVFGLLGALNAYAAELAAEHASDDEINRLRTAASAMPEAKGVKQSAAALGNFFSTLSSISHNPLLDALSRFLTTTQIGLAVKLSGGDTGDFGRVAEPLHSERMRIVAAVASRNPSRASAVTREYHRLVINHLVESRSGANDPTDGAPYFTEALTTWLRANVTVGGDSADAQEITP
ncbi:GntR family transcriptional regulator [Streptomyces sp. RS2]|uniref:FadR/GntR family transcriptional regulator n=1 Tax=Streptomyces sp. RS2 TaxID=1451205 RepID=UPI0021F8D6D7|nr:GntR family transcriptional regulator [Streptomyces sp. RS2]MCW1100163.1 GntR family transcriptional regulator [Streptomyces sp. RS2]